MTELKKCTNELCDRAVKTWVAYCCEPCAQADEGHYEIHETGSPLGHTSYCETRHAERGPFRDPWALPRFDDPRCACVPGYVVCDPCRAQNYPPPRQGLRWIGPAREKP